MKYNNIKKIFNLAVIVICLTATHLNAQDNTADVTDTAPAYNGMLIEFNDQWSLKFSGQLNAFLTLNSVAEDKANGEDAYTANNISNGLLPASLIVNPMYKVNDKISVTGTFGLWFGLPSNGLNNNGFNKALEQSTIDVRQLFFTVSSNRFGSVDVGRNFGLFGLDAILNDISLLGVGANYSFVNPAHTSLGGIGYGYIYCDRLNQINYTTPAFEGTTLTLGMYDEINDPTTHSINPEKGLGFHLKLATTQKLADKVNLYASLSFLSQRRNIVLDNVNAFDIFAKLNIDALSLTGYYYTGSGIGDVGLLIGGTTEKNKNTIATDSDGYYIQGAYTFPSKVPFILGFNYGASNTENADPSTRFTGSLAAVVHSNLILRTELTQQSRQNTLAALTPKTFIFAIGGTFAF